MENHLALERHVIGDGGRNSDAEVDEPPLGDVVGDQLRHLWTAVRFDRGGGFGHGHCLITVWIEKASVQNVPGSPYGTCSTRSTKILGVTTWSGLSSPSSR